MNARIFIVTFVAALALAGCPRPRPPAPPVSSGPRACRDAWAGLPVQERGYDFEHDRQLGPLGNQGYARAKERFRRRECRKSWTVLLYMAADVDDLGAWALEDLREIERPFEDTARSAASTLDADVVAEVDLPGPGGVRRMHLFRAPADAPVAKRVEELASPIVEHLDPEDSDPEASLRRFLAWGATEYPADEYLVIVWGHGLGWRPEGWREGTTWRPGGLTGGIAFDATEGTVLDTPALARALEGARADAKLDRPFAIYVSDACLMQSVEVATELAGAARFVVGSEQIESWSGLPYRTLLARVNGSDAGTGTEATTPEAIAAVIPTLVAAASLEGPNDRAPEAAETFTSAAVSTAKLERALVPAIAELADALASFVDEDALRAVDLGYLLQPNARGFLGGTRDLGLFLAELGEVAESEARRSNTPRVARLASAVAKAREALGDTVIAKRLGRRYDGRSAGLAVWLPHDRAELTARAPFYAPATFHRQLGRSTRGTERWEAWLAAVFDALAVTP